MTRFGVWVLAAIGTVVTVYLLATVDLGAVAVRGGWGGAALFGLPLDLVIVMPVSWLPLVADYNRFSRRERGSFWGTFLGYLAANVWFYSLGALIVLGVPGAEPSPEGIAAGILAVGGVALTGILLLAGLLVGETDEAFADIYSAAVSAQNIRPAVGQRRAVLGVAAAGLALAVWLGLREDAFAVYESFLFLLGSVFVPLFGVFVADHFLLRRSPAEYGFDGGPSLRRPGLVGAALAAWAAGFLVYQWSVPTGPGPWQRAIEAVLHGWLGLPFPLGGSAAGASLPAFGAAMAAHLGLASLAGWLGGRLRRAREARPA
jgi:purine-cytosine permease-like protein